MSAEQRRVDEARAEIASLIGRKEVYWAGK